MEYRSIVMNNSKIKQEFFSLKIPKEYEESLVFFQNTLKENLIILPKGKLAGIIIKSSLESNQKRLMRQISSDFSDVKQIILKDLEGLEREEQKEVDAFIRKLKNRKQNAKNI